MIVLKAVIEKRNNLKEENKDDERSVGESLFDLVLMPLLGNSCRVVIHIG